MTTRCTTQPLTTLLLSLPDMAKKPLWPNDIKHAFRLCPICLEDRELLGIHWNGHFYVDLCLPFGLRSSPYALIAWPMPSNVF